MMEYVTKDEKEKIWKEADHDLIEVSSRHVPGAREENHRNPQSE
jgi:hypothetical protein